MKKINYLGLVGVGLSALLLAGCGEKSNHKLSCNLKNGEQANHLEIQFDDEDKKIKNINIEITINLGDSATDEQIEQTKEYLVAGCESSGYTKCGAKTDGKKIIYSFDSAPEFSNYNNLDNLEAVKKAVEEDGYKCE